MIKICASVLLALLFLTPQLVFGQKFDEKFEHWPVNLKINGRIIIDCGVTDKETRGQVFRRIRKDKKIIVVFGPNQPFQNVIQLTDVFRGQGSELTLATADNLSANQLSKWLAEYDVCCFYPGSTLTEKQLESIRKTKSEFTKFVDNQGTLIVDPEFAQACCAKCVCTIDQKTKIDNGINLLPDCILQTNYTDSKNNRGKILNLLSDRPRCIGIGLADETMLVLSGRKMMCFGTGQATFVLKGNRSEPDQIQTIGQQTSRRQSPQEYLIDLTQWRRQAIDRTIDPFPPAKPEKPFVENGTLVIVGGGGLPPGLMDQIVEMAGGKENAKMVYVPCSERDDVGERQRTVEMWKRMGVKHATFIHTKDRNQANSDEQFLAPLKDATGIWFGGGRQWNFADSYYGTKAHKLMKEVLQRGGVIGGSSAGASIQARYLARSTPIGNFDIMAPGYERGGLGFISGVAIDQHFSQRRRQKDMTQLVNRYPQLLGIGIDEATAIILKKSKADVMGRGRVFFYNRNLPVVQGKPDYIALPAGSSYDLADRKIIEDTTQEWEAKQKERKAKRKDRVTKKKTAKDKNKKKSDR